MARWRGIITQLNTWTGDGRRIEEIDHRELPLSFRVQRVDNGGHSEAEPCGRIDDITIEGDNVIGEGETSSVEAGEYAATVIAEGTLRGVSIDPGSVRATWVMYDPENDQIWTAQKLGELPDEEFYDLMGRCEDRLVYDYYEIGALTLVATPAFADARVEIIPAAATASAEDDETAEERQVASSGGLLVEHSMTMGALPVEHEAAPLVTRARPVRLTAGATFRPPAEAFRPPAEVTAYTPFSIDPDTGYISGHIYPWDGAHRGSRMTYLKPPQSRDFSEFLTGGSVTTDDGQTIDIGVITWAGGHCNTAEEYDRVREDPANQLGPVVLYADEFGVMACGIVWEDIDAVALARSAAAYPSGDWQPVRGEHLLCGVALVNNPGYHRYDQPGQEQRIVASYSSLSSAEDRRRSVADMTPAGRERRAALSARQYLALKDLDKKMGRV